MCRCAKLAREYHVSDVQHGHWFPPLFNKKFLLTFSIIYSLIVNKRVNSLDKSHFSRATRRRVVKILLGMLSRFSVVAELHRLEWANSLNTFVFFSFFFLYIAHHSFFPYCLIYVSILNSITGPFHLMHSLVVQKMS
jgi:hypothetical protein